MAGKQKHAERSHRSYKQHVDSRNSGIYRMASIVDRNRPNARRTPKTQQRGG